MKNIKKDTYSLILDCQMILQGDILSHRCKSYGAKNLWDPLEKATWFNIYRPVKISYKNNNNNNIQLK